MTDQESLLDVKDLTIKFQTDDGVLTAVDGVSFSIRRGEVFSLVGESGSGKSVTALSILQLLDSNSIVEADTIRFRGTDLLNQTERELQRIRGGEISIIFQDPMNSLNPVMSVGEQIAEVCRCHGEVAESAGFWHEMRRKYVTGTAKDSESWQRAVELLDTVGIPEPAQRATAYPHQLSGGMRQRVMIAMALAADPALIIADEPTTALDVSIESQILAELLELRDEFDVSVLFITHDLGVVYEISDRVAVMYAGELMELAEVGELFSNPQHPYTRGLIGSIPTIADDRDQLEVIDGTVPDLIDRPSGCPFRNRCEFAFELCEQDLVEHTVDDSEPGKHTAACHLLNKRVQLDANGHAVEVTESPSDSQSHRERPKPESVGISESSGTNKMSETKGSKHDS